eukprot:1949725-Rhodomonas_salina.1
MDTCQRRQVSTTTGAQAKVIKRLPSTFREPRSVPATERHLEKHTEMYMAMPTASNQHQALGQVLNRHFGHIREVYKVKVKGARTCLSVVGIVCTLTGKHLQEAKNYTSSLLYFKTRDEAAKVLHRKVGLPWIYGPNYVVTYEEVLPLLRILSPATPALKALMGELEEVM